MTFKAYLENIEAKTGKSPDEFVKLATKKGLIKDGKMVAKYAEFLKWLKTDMGLGHGHANAMILYFRIQTKDPSLEKSKSLAAVTKTKKKSQAKG